jgi:hypothetical protein
MAAKPYNGHPIWNAWNVSLWIGNDEALYRLAIKCLENPVHGRKPSINVATQRFLTEISGIETTPDGAIYSRTSVRHALAGLRD